MKRISRLALLLLLMLIPSTAMAAFAPPEGLFIFKVFPQYAPAINGIKVVILGNHFDDLMEIKLVKEGLPSILATDYSVNDSKNRIDALFNLSGATFGVWDLVITAVNPNDPATPYEEMFLNALTINSDTPLIMGLQPTKGGQHRAGHCNYSCSKYL